MNNSELLPDLFRSESGKITSVLSKHFSLAHIEVAEDIVSETFLLAMETWPYEGIPKNPTAWLYTVAKNKTKNHLHRDQIFQNKIKDNLISGHNTTEMPEVDLSSANIRDSQLQMLFALCHPANPGEAQIGLCLRILCGFGIGEIASAFLSNKETISKRLLRAKEKLREEKIEIALPAENEITSRLENVMRTLYLLFNEGYYSETNEKILREELCEEAIRLTCLLLENEQTNTPAVNALLALMYFHASRFKARTSETGGLILYRDQDPARWKEEYISLGAYHLNAASNGNTLSKYHLEAGIAYWHTVKDDSKAKWESILQLYNKLLQIEYSPVIALNRTYALSKANGIEEAIPEAERLKLETNPYYFALLGELYTPTSRTKAKEYFQKALALVKSDAEKISLKLKIESL
jgi:RNA polymerase sigma-70 factor (ECF subfamily)